MAGYLFDDCAIPADFRFPGAYLDVMAEQPIPYFEPWWFLAEYPENAANWWNILRERYPHRTLIPFAKYGDEAEVACFDGSDFSGDPVVHHVHADEPPGFEGGGTEHNFAAWLETTKQHSKDWRAARSDQDTSSD